MGSTSEDQPKPPQKPTPPLPEPVYAQQPYNYPPQYPPYPPPHHAYANPGYATAPPPAAYYYSQQYQYQPRPSSTRYVFLAVMLFTFFALTLMLVAGSDIPEFNVQSLYVQSFNVTNDALSATWNANITVKKHNENLDILFDRIEGVMFSYNDDNALGISQDHYFDMGMRKEAMFNMTLSTSSLQQPTSGGIYKELVKEKGKGSVTFSLKLLAVVTYRSGTLWVRHAKFKILCEDLEVRFASPDGSGNLVVDKDKKNRCILYGNRMYADE